MSHCHVVSMLTVITNLETHSRSILALDRLATPNIKHKAYIDLKGTEASWFSHMSGTIYCTSGTMLKLLKVVYNLKFCAIYLQLTTINESEDYFFQFNQFNWSMICQKKMKNAHSAFSQLEMMVSIHLILIN